ncbi:Nucleotidyltransferase [Planctomycetales bacterium 10988]|nr:Nucleotidyltransferase [Planctomycetales bacterium 10988]
MDQDPFNNKPVQFLQTGTIVVTLVAIKNPKDKILFPTGAIGIVVRSPKNTREQYLVKFPDTSEHYLPLNQVVMLSKFKEKELNKGTSHSNSVAESLGEETGSFQQHPLYQRIIYRCIVGSRAYGLDDDESDVDYRGIYLPPAELQWSLSGAPEQLECDETQEVYWELEKFLVMALKANPNILECLYSSYIERATPLMEELLDLKEIFLSKLVYQTYSGYVASQFKKIQSRRERKKPINWKHVMHLLRLLLSGTFLLKEGKMKIRVDQHRDRLLAIKHGSVTFEETEAWRLELQTAFDAAFQKSSLPDRPDYERANRFLIYARNAAIQESLP